MSKIVLQSSAEACLEAIKATTTATGHPNTSALVTILGARLFIHCLATSEPLKLQYQISLMERKESNLRSLLPKWDCKQLTMHKCPPKSNEILFLCYCSSLAWKFAQENFLKVLVSSLIHNISSTKNRALLRLQNHLRGCLRDMIL